MDAPCTLCPRSVEASTLDPKGRCSTCAPCEVCGPCGHVFQPVDGPCSCHDDARERAAARRPRTEADLFEHGPGRPWCECELCADVADAALELHTQRSRAA